MLDVGKCQEAATGAQEEVVEGGWWLSVGGVRLYLGAGGSLSGQVTGCCLHLLFVVPALRQGLLGRGWRRQACGTGCDAAESAWASTFSPGAASSARAAVPPCAKVLVKAPPCLGHAEPELP